LTTEGANCIIRAAPLLLLLEAIFVIG
jgi:hypothetical protein